MLKAIEVEFDGKAFVPTEPIDLPAGARLTITLPDAAAAHQPGPITNQRRPMTDEEKRRWEELRRHWEETPPPFPTVEEAIAYSRGRPWPELLLAPEPAEPSETKTGVEDKGNC